MIFEIQDTLVSSELISQRFVCDIKHCQGMCCVEGDTGAPIEDAERKELSQIYPKIESYLTAEGIEAIKQQGFYIKGEDGEWETPLIENGSCAYATFDEKGIVSCGIEQAYLEGNISWRKPLSCHLYPVRVRAYERFIAVNYSSWDICNTACQLGQSLEVPLYKFLKIPLIRKFGQQWYDELVCIARNYPLD